MTATSLGAQAGTRGELAALWRWFAGQFATSPVYTAIAGAVADDEDILDLVLQSPPPAHLPLVLMAGAHYLLLGGLDHPLAAIYDGSSGHDRARAPELFRDLCLSHRRELLEVMASRRIQTNEVGRSALIAPALTTVATAGGPLHLVDVGCSAGITLCCDRFLLDYGSFGTTGPSTSRVHVDCEVRSGTPPIAASLGSFATKVGIDLEPPNLDDADDVRWLLACIWPDSGRLERARRAIDVARAERPEVRTGDAVEVLPDVLDGIEADGVVCVLTTWSFGYFSAEQRQGFIDLLAARGCRRTVVWICEDGPGVMPLVPAAGGAEEGEVLSEATFDSSGVHARVLARVHAHGHWLDWRA